MFSLMGRSRAYQLASVVGTSLACLHVTTDIQKDRVVIQ